MHGDRPRRGSMAFYPRKRAKRIYPALTVFKGENIIEGFAGYKVGMLHVMAIDNKKGSPSYGQEIMIPATVIETPPLFVFGIRAYIEENKTLRTFTEFYSKELPKYLKRKISTLPKDNSKNRETIEAHLECLHSLRLLVSTQPHKIGLKKTPEVFELVLNAPVKEAWEFALSKIGKELNVEEVFNQGDVIDVCSITKGKGTQGPVKRFGVKKQRHKASQKVRHVGCIGAWGPARVFYTVPMAGQTGFQRRTEYNKLILKIADPDEVNKAGGYPHYGVVKTKALILKGSVPGPQKRLIMMRKALREYKEPMPTITEIVK